MARAGERGWGEEEVAREERVEEQEERMVDQRVTADLAVTLGNTVAGLATSWPSSRLRPSS